MYKKRSGTGGLHGQLYETKLLSLLNYRAKHDDDIEEFYLATNVDLIGDFDDICLRAKVKGVSKNMAIFIQTKHRETVKVLSLSIKRDLLKYFKSYLKVRRAFGTKNKSKLFEGTFNETECLFVMYTNSKYDFNNDLVETEYTNKLKELIGTRQEDSYIQPTYDDDEAVYLHNIILDDEVEALAEHFAKLLNKEVIIEGLVSSYHYILAQKVFEIPDTIVEGRRIASFRKDFFDTKEHYVLMFKNTLYEKVLLKRKIDKPQTLNHLEKIFNRTSDDSEVDLLSELIGTVITYKNGKLEFIKTMPETLKRQLSEVSISQSTADKAFDQAARKVLGKAMFKVPLAFGNKDLTIRGNKAKVESRLELLSSKIVDLINDAKPSTVITIDESLEAGLLKVNGGFAGLVGNLFAELVAPKTYPKSISDLHFAENVESIKGDLAKRLYLKLQKKINNLEKYTIFVTVKEFPKLSFESGKRNPGLVKEFLRNMIFFTNQSNETEIGEVLKREIGDRPYDGTHIFQVNADAIFLKYHHAIQKWWMRPDTAEYLTKQGKHFKNAIDDVVIQPLISVMNVIHTFKMQNFKYTFSAAAVGAFKMLVDEQCNTNVNVIVTDNCQFTVAKLTQYLKKKQHVVLDRESILKLLPDDYKKLRNELAKNKDTVIIVNYGKWCGRLNDIVKIVEARLFIISKTKPSKIVSFVHDSENNLIDLSDESQQTFLMDTKVNFQEVEVSLGLLVKDKQIKELIKGDILQTMLEKKIFKIGIPIGNQNYENIKHLYTDRRVSRTRKTDQDAFDEVKNKTIQTLDELQDHVILVTAMPGMGKSSLLTHLSIKTKELHPSTWIVRINLLEYSKIFRKWQKDETVVDLMLSLSFMSSVALGVAEKDIRIDLQTDVNNVVSLKYCSGDASIIFGLEMFLHFYNSGTQIFIFDGFDEIFPHYAREALSLVKTVRTYPRQHKIWITSRSYNNIKDKLEQEFGRSYDMEHFSDVEQIKYLIKFWINSNLHRRMAYERGEELYVPCYRPCYSCWDYRNEQALPTFKVFLSSRKIFDVDTIDEFPSISNTVWEVDRNRFNYTNDFCATPLNLNLIAYMTSKSLGITSDLVHSNYVSVTMFELYENFVKQKLKKIRFEEKNKMDLNIPDNLLTYEREHDRVLSKHKQLGAYAIFYPGVDLIFNDNELKEVMETINMLKSGEEKSGFIHSVAGNMPLFIHKLIAEYFAAIYIDDLLKTDITYETKKVIIDLCKQVEVFKMLLSKRIRDRRESNAQAISKLPVDKRRAEEWRLIFSASDAYSEMYKSFDISGEQI